MNISLLGVFSLSILILSLPGTCAQTRVTGYIGSHNLTFSAFKLETTADFSISSSADYAAITEVLPDTPESLAYSYRITTGNTALYDRVCTSPGFGRQTYFIRLPKGGVESIRLINTSGTPVLIGSVRGVTQAELIDLQKNDKFLLMGLIPPSANGDIADALMREISENLAQKPEYGILRGFSREVQFASADGQRVREQFQECSKWSGEHDLPAMIGLVSWWSGTPGHVPDGLGGKFGDTKYQQVCYSPDVDMPENPELKALVGERYNSHYGLSVPNQWSNCPWLTMNSDHLNQYRCKRLIETAALLSEVCGNDCSWIDSLYLDNEPRYWDTECEAGNPKASRQGKTLWADFNPLVIKDAKHDGIDLNPNDGLSSDELAWLHRNVGRYNQMMVDGIREALSAYPQINDMPVYTHTLQHKHSFPGADIGHPLSEWGYADGARTGIEGIWTMPSDFYRVREWGRWSNLNREECDGLDIATHLWDLRVTYMMGADLYNSYNWQAIGSQRFFAYVKEFIDNLPVATAHPASVKVINNNTMRLRTPMNLQAFTGLRMNALITQPVKGTATLTVTTTDATLYTSDMCNINLNEGEADITFGFTTPAESKWNADAIVKLRVYDMNGGESDAVRFTAGSETPFELSLDLRRQRALSLWIINQTNRE